MITVVLADDHPLVRRGLRTVLEAESDVEVLAEGGDGLETLRLVERLKPHVLVVDLAMPRMTGIEVARRAAELASPPRVVLLSMHADEAYVLDALRAGASAYVLKETSADELVRAVRAVAAGERYLSPALSQRAYEAYAGRAQEAPAAPHESLTPREREVLQMVAEGSTSADIGDVLHLSPRTVETHRATLMRKLGLRTRTDLIRYALQHGILPPG